MDSQTIEQFAAIARNAEKAEKKELKALHEKQTNNVDALIEKKKITATEAKNIAETTQIPLGHIYKCIREEAKEGRTKLDWCSYSMSSKCVESIKITLIKDGYSVESSDDLLIIKW